MNKKSVLLYRFLAVFILMGTLPALVVGLRLVSLSKELLATAAGQSGWVLPPEGVAQITQSLAGETTAYLVYTFITVGIFALFASSSLIQPVRSVQKMLEDFMSGRGKEMWTPGKHGESAAEVENQTVTLQPAVTQPSSAVLGQSDEFGQLATALSGLMSNLTQLQQDLETQVKERTQDLEHRARQLQAAASVAQDSASIGDLDDLLNRVANSISQNFSYYHVGIFLLDENNETAVLRAANSDGGKQMLERGHKLKLGETSIVGYVANTRQSRLALDVGADAVHFKNPFLPQTRSEVALPLITGRQAANPGDDEGHKESTEQIIDSSAITGGRLWGVLDVQSTAEAAFTEQDIAVLQILANQVAIAIENAQLLIENKSAVTELQTALETSRKLYGELTREAWSKLLQARPDSSYISRAESGKPVSAEARVDVTPLTTGGGNAWQPEMLAVSQSGQSMQPDAHTLLIPIRIREYTAGVLRLRKALDTPGWSRPEVDLIHNLADQLSVALESARLYEETRRRAERERLTGEITAKLRASNDPQVILQTAVNELRQALQASQARITIQTTSADTTAADLQAGGPGTDGGSKTTEENGL
jgi:GAF domain-containing protein